MVKTAWIASVVTMIALAGCSDAAPESLPEDVLEPGEVRVHSLRFGAVPFAASEQQTGQFEFLDNDQFAGETERRLGQDPDNVHWYDVSGLLPAEGLYSVTAAVSGNPGGGDLDVFFEGDDIMTTYCDCPFGGETSLTGYGLPGSGSLLVGVQFDEISSGPNDPNFALQGFSYTLDIRVENHAFVPPGLPIAVNLLAGDTLQVANATSPVTVYGADDVQVKMLEEGDVEFIPEASGEYVLIARLDGGAYEATITAQDGANRPYRLLETILAEGAGTGTGGAASTGFVAPASTIEIGVCGFAGDVTVNPHLTVTSPSGEIWAETASDGPQPLGWGSCHSRWPGSPNIEPGGYDVSMEEAAGEGVEIYWWTTSYRR